MHVANTKYLFEKNMTRHSAGHRAARRALSPKAMHILCGFYDIKKTVTKFRWLHRFDKTVFPRMHGRAYRKFRNIVIGVFHTARALLNVAILPRFLGSYIYFFSCIYNWVTYEKMLALNGSIVAARPTVAVCFLRGNNEPSELLERWFAPRYLGSSINSP